jgi:hypothetical protein
MKKKNIIALIIIIALGISIFVFHPHTYKVDAQTASSCTESGSTIYKCWCGKSYTEKVPAIGHNYVKEITKESTCSENGVATFTCSVCGDSYTEDIISTGHNYVASSDNIDADNCVSYTCSVCGDSYKEDNHSYSYITEENKKSYICDKCSFELFHIDLYDEAKDMYAQSDCDIYEGPDANDFEKVLTLKTNDAVEVIGVVDEYNGKEVYWTAVKINGEEYYISGVYLSDSKVQTTTSSGNSSQQQQSSGSQQQSSGNTGGSSSAWDILNSNVNHDYSTSGEATGDGVGETGINWQ